MGKADYHHGNLRQALLDAAVETLSDVGEANLSLRKLAKQLGVSHNAPYQHFADKDALIAAIAEQGFVMLSEALLAAISQFEQPTERLLAGSQAYVDFALAHPHHFGVMFHYYDPETYPAQSVAALHAFGHLVGVIEYGQASGLFIDAHADDLAMTVWALLHGLASILVAGKLPGPPEATPPPQVMTRVSVERLLQGILA